MHSAASDLDGNLGVRTCCTSYNTVRLPATDLELDKVKNYLSGKTT